MVTRLLVGAECNGLCNGLADGRVVVRESGEVLGFDGEEDQERSERVG